MKNVLLTIAYDGTDFCGWQKQPDQKSVQEEVEKALGIVCARPIRINGAGRTDAGVHACGQRANFTAEFSIPTDKIPLAANAVFAAAASEKSRKASGEVAILSAAEVPADFHARFSAVGKKYIYKINNSRTPDPFQRNYCYQICRSLDLDAMRQAAEYLPGTRDFKCFQAAGGRELESTVRTVYCTRFVLLGDGMIGFEIIGDGFLYNMVRIIAGTLVEAGLGRISPDSLRSIMEGKERQKAGHTAPPQGLYLSEVFYEKDELREAIRQCDTGA